MPSVFEYIDFGWPPGRLRTTRVGGIRRVRAWNPTWRLAGYAIIRLSLATPPAPWRTVPAIHQIIGHKQPPTRRRTFARGGIRLWPKPMYSEIASIGKTIGKN